MRSRVQTDSSTSNECTGGIFVSRCEFGLGVFAVRPFSRGEWILRFSGPEVEFDSTVASGSKGSYPLQIDRSRYVDIVPPGRFINHSCNPNVGLHGPLDLYALRAISAGEEIRFDYSTTMSERFWTMECRCGMPDCRRIVRDFHDLPSVVKHRYLNLGVVSPFIVEEIRQTIEQYKHCTE